MRIRGLLILGILMMIECLRINAQVNSIVVLEYARQISALKNGILIVELPLTAEPGIRTSSSGLNGATRSKEEVNSLKESFIKSYHFSEFYFFSKQNEFDKYKAGESKVEDINGNSLLLTISDKRDVFIAEYVSEYSDKPECYYLKKGKPNKTVKSEKPANDFNKNSSLYNPEILVEGGIIIRRNTPLIRVLNKKKSLVSDFVYKRRVHLTLPVAERFNESVSELNLKLEKEYAKSLKYNANIGSLK